MFNFLCVVKNIIRRHGNFYLILDDSFTGNSHAGKVHYQLCQ